MRRIIIIGAAALAVLGGAAVAFAAGNFNSYKATETFSPNAAGSSSKPAAFKSITEDWQVKGVSRPAGPLTKIVAKIYGQKTNGQDFPTCTATKINAAGTKHGWNKVCPKGSLIGQGPVNSEFVNPNPPYAVAGQCNPYLYIYNGGPKTQVFFFVEGAQSPDPSKYTCLGGAVPTGSAPAYNGNISYQGKDWVLTIPLPATVSTRAGNTPEYASLLHLHVTYKSANAKKGGKSIPYGESVACSGSERPWSFTFTAKNYNEQSPPTQTSTVSGKQKCTK